MSDSIKRAPLTPEQQEEAALAALDLLPPHEAMTVPREAIAQMTEAAALLGESITPVAPRPTVRNRLLARIADFERLRPIAEVRRDEGAWVPLGPPGVEFRPLFHEAATGRSTYLVRMAAGARVAAHRHGDVEQCLVLKGDIRSGEMVYEEGDFIVMDKGTIHPEIHSVNGNLLLIIAGHNEFQQTPESGEGG
jgi:anti-sigma factor ChrR (cupin superfamily)